VAEAELELRSWYDANPGARRGAFGPEGQGTGVKVARAFPIEEATALLKLKCVSFSVSCSFVLRTTCRHELGIDPADSSPIHTSLRRVRSSSHERVESSRRGLIR
jgi:hypothetical protein